MRLSELLEYDSIVVQCHDNPDADALASGYGVYTYLKDRGKDVRFVYGGRFLIQKSNLVLMVTELEIPIEHVDALEAPELLVTVDCQYGEGNVTKFDAGTVASVLSSLISISSSCRSSLTTVEHAPRLLRTSLRAGKSLLTW